MSTTATTPNTLEWLLEPLDSDVFLGKYYERDACFVNRKRSIDYFARLVTWADLDRVLGTEACHYPDVVLVQSGRTIDRAEFVSADGLIDPRRVMALYDGGATIVFNQLQTRVPSLARLCTSLSGVFPGRVQTNIYLTPPNAQGFASHWDTHDVFVLQIAGSKTWRLYDTPIQLPLRGQTFESAAMPAVAVRTELQLEAGDVLYVPRGLVHSAHATVDCSMHVTVGIIASTWTDLFVEAVCAAGLDNVALRESLPLGFQDLPIPQRGRLLGEKLAVLLPALKDDALFSATYQQLLSQRRPVFANLLEQTVTIRDLSARSRLRVRPDAHWQLVMEPNRPHVTFAGTDITFPAAAEPILREIRERPTFIVGELVSRADLESALTIVRRLVREGLLERV